MSTSCDRDILDRFSPSVRTWFRDVFAHPTTVQEGAWNAISAGENALVVAPTGSGKTLAAFLWAINSLVVDVRRDAASETAKSAEPPKASPGDKGTRGVRVLYISPLKALGVDVENNLRAPLTGINTAAARLGQSVTNISVAVRSGDTPSNERSRQLRTPPDILITTPESLYLMLTSKARRILETVDTVIVDEIHAIAGTKRGVHLALSLERLQRLAKQPLQRIGLSATVRPLDTVAKFLGGGRPVEIINPPAQKQWELRVHVPVEDMSQLPEADGAFGSGFASGIADGTSSSSSGAFGKDMIFDDDLGVASGSQISESEQAAMPESALPTQNSIWPFIETQIYDEVMSHRSTLVFVNSRRTAERLTSRLNEIYAERNDRDSLSPQLRRPPAQIMKAVDTAGQAPAIIARAHHGSVSKDERALTESMLKEGELRAVVSTSS